MPLLLAGLVQVSMELTRGRSRSTLQGLVTGIITIRSEARLEAITEGRGRIQQQRC